MDKPSFINNETNIVPLDEVKGEPSYEEKIQSLENKDLIIKKLKSFSSQNEALSYANATPNKRNDNLSKFIPQTEYVLGNEGPEAVVYAFTKRVDGTRMDKVNLKELSHEVAEQLDYFWRESLEVYTKEAVCPGISYKNFVIDTNNKLWYVDSEPYPSNIHENFELAHAREVRLTRDFGEKAETLFPKTWEWIQNNRVENYQKAKSEAESRRRHKD